MKFIKSIKIKLNSIRIIMIMHLDISSNETTNLVYVIRQEWTYIVDENVGVVNY
jgi:hypothetical protein